MAGIKHFIEFKKFKKSNWTVLKGYDFKLKEDRDKVFIELINNGSYYAYRIGKDKIKYNYRNGVKPGRKLTVKSFEIIYKSIQTQSNEQAYAELPTEQIPALKLQDMQDYSNWKKLPRLITV